MHTSGQADLPHPALQSMVLPQRGRTQAGTSRGPGTTLRPPARPRAPTCTDAPAAGSRSRLPPVPSGAPARGRRVATGRSRAALSGRCVLGDTVSATPSSGTPWLDRRYPAAALLWVLRVLLAGRAAARGASRSPCLRARNFRPFCPQPPVAAPESWSGCVVRAYRVSAPARARHPRSSGSERQLGFAVGVQARHRHRPNQVRHPADWSFTSGGSPPRLAAAQLPSVPGFRPNPDGDLHPAVSSRAQAHTPAASCGR
jgi:hypothetical protein